MREAACTAEAPPRVYSSRSGAIRAAAGAAGGYEPTFPHRRQESGCSPWRGDSAGRPQPTLIWTHGGGFVGGDKSGIETWATLAAARGYVVVSTNYARAPDALYPVPVVLFGEVHDFLRQNPERFPFVDLRRLMVGGDSAGAQIAGQFAALQTNPSLAAAMQLEPVVAPGDLAAVVLYCGPYDLRGLYAVAVTDSVIENSLGAVALLPDLRLTGTLGVPALSERVAARTLLLIAARNPRALLDVA